MFEIDFRRIFALALTLGTIFVYTVLLSATLAYRGAITDYAEKVMISKYVTSNSENISSFNSTVSVDSAIDASSRFLHCKHWFVLPCCLYSALYYIHIYKQNPFSFHDTGSGILYVCQWMVPDGNCIFCRGKGR